MEEYTERSLLETILRNVGFDVVSVANEFAIAEQMIAFGPDVLIAGGSGKRTSSYSVGRKMKEAPPQKTKIILLVPEKMPLRNEQLTELHFDAIIETPAKPMDFFTALGKTSGRDPAVLFDKYKKIKLGAEEQKRLDEENSLFVTVTHMQQNAVALQQKNDEQRVAEYAKLIVDPSTVKVRHFPRGTGKKLLPAEDQGIEQDDLDRLDQEKQEFLEAMFSKAGGKTEKA